MRYTVKIFRRRSTRLGAALLVGTLVGALVGAIAPAAAVAQQPSPSPSPARSATKPGTGTLSPNLARLSRPEVSSQSTPEQSKTVGLPPEGAGSLLRDGRLVVVYIRVAGAGAEQVAALEAAGAEVTHVADDLDVVTANVSPDRLTELSTVPGVLSVTEALIPQINRGSGTVSSAPGTNAVAPCGSRTSEAVTQLRVDQARDARNVDGTGVAVGVLSDSYNVGAGLPTTAAADVATGDLPGAGNPCGRTTPVQVLQEISNSSGAVDEGRAMLQLVHDLAPGSPLKFASAFNGFPSFASNIRALQTAGSKAIVDDISYFEEPFFQDGPISVAVNDVTAAGAAYFSSAANSNLIFGGNDVASYEAPAFRSAPCPGIGLPPYVTDCLDFNPGAGTDSTYGITLAPNGRLVLNFQWAEPWNGVTTDLDIYITNSAGNVVAASERFNLNTQTPFEFVSHTNFSGANQALNVVINRFEGTATPRLRMIHQRTSNVVAMEYGTPSAEVLPLSIFGHNGAEKAGSTAANPYFDAQTPEPFSSRGKPVLYFGPVSGTTPAPPLPTPRVLNKPDYSATDGACNTFFLGARGSDGCYRFFGTSAAAPHAAAVAALLRQAEPTLTEPQVQNRLRYTAAPMANGTVLSVGAGRIDALAALGTVTFAIRDDSQLPLSLTTAELRDIYNCTAPLSQVRPLLPPVGSNIRQSFLERLGFTPAQITNFEASRSCINNGRTPPTENIGNQLADPLNIVPHATLAYQSQIHRTVLDVHGRTILGRIDGIAPTSQNPAAAAVTFTIRDDSQLPLSLTTAELRNIYNCTAPLSQVRPLLPPVGSSTRQSFLQQLGFTATEITNFEVSRSCINNGRTPPAENTGNQLADPLNIAPHAISAYQSQIYRTVPDVHGRTILGLFDNIVPTN